MWSSWWATSESDMRASVSRETLNNYFIVKEWMSAVSTFDPRRSVAKWSTLRQRPPKTSESVEKVQKYLTNDFVRTFFSSWTMFSLKQSRESFVSVSFVHSRITTLAIFKKVTTVNSLSNWCYFVIVWQVMISDYCFVCIAHKMFMCAIDWFNSGYALEVKSLVSCNNVVSQNMTLLCWESDGCRSCECFAMLN